MPLIQDFRYRPEIDGLRAIAVLAVVLFHSGLGVTGGYIGVDVFFVISGFLITSLIIRDLETGKFTPVNFWERRIRRILPALAVVVLVTLLAGWFLLLPDDYALLGKSAFFQALCAANIYFWRGIDTGYFGGLVEELPLLHTWSLAVEEQFYMIVPLLLIGLFRIPMFRRRGFLLSLFATGIAISFVASIYGVVHHPAATFYLLPTRAWELLCGALIAILPISSLQGSRILREVLTWLALAVIIFPCFLYTKQTPFPGLAALPPCLGTALFIWATANRHPLTAARLLSTRPIVFIGLISYSLYLWHWPVFAFSTYWALEPMSLGYRLALVMLGLLLAVLSWRFVETPFRKRQWCASRNAIFVFGVGASTAVVALGVILYRTSGLPQRMPAEAQDFARAKTEMAFHNQLTIEDVQSGKLVPIGTSAPGLHVDWLIWGDSHAMAALPAFDAFLKEIGRSGLAATHTSTPPVLNYIHIGRMNHDGLEAKSPAYNDAVFDYLKSKQIRNVVLIARWGSYDDKDLNLVGNQPYADALLTTVRRIAAAGSQPWVLLEVPLQPFNVPRGLARFAISGEDIGPLCAKPDLNREIGGGDPEFQLKLQKAGARILDPRPAFLSEDRSYYNVVSRGVPLYRDAHHLTTRGAVAILLPLLRESIATRL